MKKMFILALLAILAMPLAAFSPEELNSIYFENNTGSEIYFIFLSPGDSEFWGPELLGSQRTLLPNESIGYYIHYPEYSATFDVLAIDENGNSFLLFDLEINDDAPAYINLDAEALEELFEIPQMVNLTIANETDYEMLSVFISPEDSVMLGVDFLDEVTTLASGESFSVLLIAGELDLQYDVYSIDIDSDVYSFALSLDPELEEMFVAIEASDYDPDL